MADKKARKPEKSAKKASTRRVASKAAKSRKPTVKLAPKNAASPKLLSGGNPQIPKGDGDAPVQAYIAAMPGWKRAVGHKLDALAVRTVPGVRKAVKWNSPFYGIEGQGWFLSLHCFTRYIKVAFFRGAALRPLPPGASKHKDVRYLDIHEGDELDEAELSAWIRQAAALPGWMTQLGKGGDASFGNAGRVEASPYYASRGSEAAFACPTLYKNKTGCAVRGRA
jgi:hypothetical protein